MRSTPLTPAQKRAAQEYDRAHKKAEQAQDTLRWAQVAYVQAQRDEAKKLQRAKDIGAIKP